MGQCIAVVSGKGGTGKTSFTAGVGAALALSGLRVLCVDCDINDPRVLRAAALKGADVALSVQALDPVQDAGERLLRTVWSGAQGNNLYVVNIAAGSAAVACPAGVTRAGDGYLIRQTSSFPVRFGLNMARLDEIRRGLRLLEQINPALIANYEAELGR